MGCGEIRKIARGLGVHRGARERGKGAKRTSKIKHEEDCTSCGKSGVRQHDHPRQKTLGGLKKSGAANFKDLRRGRAGEKHNAHGLGGPRKNLKAKATKALGVRKKI